MKKLMSTVVGESQSMLNSTDYQIKSTIEPDEP
jgi:hypothetical protein